MVKALLESGKLAKPGNSCMTVNPLGSQLQFFGLAQQHAPPRRPHFSHHESEDPVPPRGTLDRFLLRTEQTGWAVAYRAVGFVLTLFYQRPESELETLGFFAYPLVVLSQSTDRTRTWRSAGCLYEWPLDTNY